jgi:hypothetical protein
MSTFKFTVKIGLEPRNALDSEGLQYSEKISEILRNELAHYIDEFFDNVNEGGFPIYVDGKEHWMFAAPTSEVMIDAEVEE